jgi:hypothetical protein
MQTEKILNSLCSEFTLESLGSAFLQGEIPRKEAEQVHCFETHEKQLFKHFKELKFMQHPH